MKHYWSARVAKDVSGHLFQWSLRLPNGEDCFTYQPDQCPMIVVGPSSLIRITTDLPCSGVIAHVELADGKSYLLALTEECGAVDALGPDKPCNLPINHPDWHRHVDLDGEFESWPHDRTEPWNEAVSKELGTAGIWEGCDVEVSPADIAACIDAEFRDVITVADDAAVKAATSPERCPTCGGITAECDSYCEP